MLMRSSGRRSGGQYERRRDEEYGRDEEPARPRRGQDADSLIADMAQGFVEAQAKIAGAPAGGGDREMIAILAKISRQLDELKSAQACGQQITGQEQGSGANQENAAQEKSGRQDDLSAIFSRLLAENKVAAGPKQQGGVQQAGGRPNGAGRQDGGVRQKNGSGQGDSQNSAQSGNQGGSQVKGGGQSVTAQTAAQALAQAQYELANELEASLTKLKQVISESEKLADRISNLLGQENSSRQT